MNDQTQLAKADPKPQIAAGGPLAALVPQNLDEAFRLSQALARSGEMVPKHFQGQPEQIMAAVMRGAEIGLMPMQALSNIAVINGRASLWGDALPAIIQRAGHQLDCEVTGEGESMIATATLIRGDTGQQIVRTFSVADAKKASLWGKTGPWQTYPKRMLAMRARSWAVRDGAADALMGLQVAEEMQDAPRMRDVTPREGPNLAQRLASNPVEKIDTPATAPESAAEADVVDGQAEIPAEPETSPYEALDVSDAAPGSAAWDRGCDAFDEGKPITTCPYDIGTPEAVDFCGAWRMAQRALE
jgi:hypothetical protein